MLVLTQKEGEILQIGDDIKIYIKRVKGNWVRLCIDAPREVPLLRIPVEKTAERDRGGAGRPGRPRDEAAPRPAERQRHNPLK
jgi:carbon storage regulator